MSGKLIELICNLPQNTLIGITFLIVLVGLLAPQQAHAADPPSTGRAANRPIIFDVETLRENYFKDWRIESAAININTLEPQSVTAPVHTFNVEKLRQNYFKDWRIEAGVIDARIIK